MSARAPPPPPEVGHALGSARPQGAVGKVSSSPFQCRERAGWRESHWQLEAAASPQLRSGWGACQAGARVQVRRRRHAPALLRCSAGPPALPEREAPAAHYVYTQHRHACPALGGAPCRTISCSAAGAFQATASSPRRQRCVRTRGGACPEPPATRSRAFPPTRPGAALTAAQSVLEAVAAGPAAGARARSWRARARGSRSPTGPGRPMRRRARACPCATCATCGRSRWRCAGGAGPCSWGLL